MKILITGGTGFIGRHVIAQALAEGHQVVALKRPGGVFEAIPAPIGLVWVESQLCNVPLAILRDCQAMVHLAAHGVVAGHNDWAACFRVNVTESLELWQRAADAGIKRFIICGSCFEYGRSGERYEFIPVDAPLEPTGAYHASKAAATMAALGLAVDRKLELIVLRPFHVYGEGESPKRLWSSLKKAALEGSDFPMTWGEQVRDFVSVHYVANSFVKALVVNIDPGAPMIKNISSGIPESIRDFASKWWTVWQARGKLKFGEINYREDEIMRYVGKK